MINFDIAIFAVIPLAVFALVCFKLMRNVDWDMDNINKLVVGLAGFMGVFCCLIAVSVVWYVFFRV